MQILADSQTDYISSFIENIHNIDNLYNKPMQMMFDSENIYIEMGISGEEDCVLYELD